MAETEKLKALQEAVDDPAAAGQDPDADAGRPAARIRTVPIEIGTLGDVRLFYHDLPTLGIVYLDLGFDLHVLDKALLPYLPLFGRALLQTGTSKEDFVSLTQRIGRSTGGIAQHRGLSSRQGSDGSAAWFFLSGKAVPDKIDEMLAIMGDVLLDARLDNRERFKQMALEEKAGSRRGWCRAGNAIVDTRLKSGLTEASWIAEQLGGVSYLQLPARAGEAGRQRLGLGRGGADAHSRYAVQSRADAGQCDGGRGVVGPGQGRDRQLPRAHARMPMHRLCRLERGLCAEVGRADHSGAGQLCGQGRQSAGARASS